MRCLRSIPASFEEEASRLYLTFDDGPDARCTEDVLKLLEVYQARATFFLIAEKAKQHTALVKAMQARGDTIGNHSLDHRYRFFFSRRAVMRDWIVRSEEILSSITGIKTIGFRSPAGIRTPPLHACLKQLQMPLIHWSVRFYDTARVWTVEKARTTLARIQPGAIILLHDTHAGLRREVFLHTLETFLADARQQGFSFEAITPSDVARAL
jgi:peptidoglycan-N-acetylglucosamine deacetylase